MTKQVVSVPEAVEEAGSEFIAEVDERLAGEEDTCHVVEEVLVDLHGDRNAYDRWQNGKSVSPAEKVRLQSYDPCNATLESEYYAEKDEEQFERSKHLQWLWQQFDATPMADNVAFALRFRQMLANHLFEECGDDCRFFKGITFTYGHNITVGDNVVVHDDVHLDDRGRLTIGDRASISDGVHVYTHDHDVVDQTEVRNYHTIIGDDARITYDSMVRAGAKVGENAIVGAKSVVRNDVPVHHIAVGQPAKSVKIKPGREDVAEPLDADTPGNKGNREIPYDLPDDLDVFDEFERDVDTPVSPHERPRDSSRSLEPPEPR